MTNSVDDLEIGFFIYNAAAEPRGLFLDTSDQELVRNVHMNCTVPTLITKTLARKMVKRGRGGIALCSSGGTLQGLRSSPPTVRRKPTSYYSPRASGTS